MKRTHPLRSGSLREELSCTRGSGSGLRAVHSRSLRQRVHQPKCLAPYNTTTKLNEWASPAKVKYNFFGYPDRVDKFCG